MLGDNVLRSFDGFGRVLHITFDKALGRVLGMTLKLHHQRVGQRLQSTFAGYLCPCAPLGLEGQIKVFELCGIPTGRDAIAQFVGEFALLLNGFEDGVLALLHLFELVVEIADGSYLHLVEVAGSLFAIAADEGNGTARVEQVERSVDLLGTDMKMFGNKRSEGVH